MLIQRVHYLLVHGLQFKSCHKVVQKQHLTNQTGNFMFVEDALGL